MQIKFTVDGKEFDTLMLAEDYVKAQDPIKLSLAAFEDYLKSKGAQRINKAGMKLVEEYARWNADPYGCPDTETSAQSAESQSVTTEAPVTKESPVQTASDNDTDDDRNAVSEQAAVPTAGAVKKSEHVAGPDENVDDDPLAGLDI